MSIDTWEYDVIRVERHTSVNELLRKIQYAGANGWEAVCELGFYGDVILIKRKVPGASL